jgi:hypothetical protein
MQLAGFRQKLSIIGKDYYTKERVAGCYDVGGPHEVLGIEGLLEWAAVGKSAVNLAKAG